MILKLKQKVKPGSFLRHVLTVASGTAIAQVIAVLVSPIITRMYTPEDMGVLASFTAIVAILGVVAAGRYELAIVLPKTDRESNAVSFAGLIFALVFPFVITMIVVLFNKPLVALLKLQGVAASWLYLLGLFVFLSGLELVLNRIAIRNRHFRVIASTQVTQQISNNGIKIGWGFFSPDSFALFVSTLFSTVSRVGRLGIGEFKYLFSKENRPSKQEIKQAIIRYKYFPLISSWSGLLNSASVQLPVVLFTTLFSPAVAGFYSLSHRILSLPMSLIGKSVGDVFLERAAKAKDDDKELGRITLAIFKKLLLIGSLILSFVTFYGDMLFPFLFGSQWLEAGKYAQWISIWIFFQLGISPLSQIMIIFEKNKEHLFWNCLLLFSRIAFVPFVFLKNTLLIIAIYSILSSFFYLIYALRILKLCKIKTEKIVGIFSFFCFIYLIQFIFSLLLRKLIFR
ncbi:MAG: oligosaccharide flippase family protein [Crenarchaeota archaeon]|nr:oligosaccharide flippase family protein [Thermoproteota archaeon]